jgi:hypothetical protein
MTAAALPSGAPPIYLPAEIHGCSLFRAAPLRASPGYFICGTFGYQGLNHQTMFILEMISYHYFLIWRNNFVSQSCTRKGVAI